MAAIITDQGTRETLATWSLLTEPSDAEAGQLIRALGRVDALDLLRGRTGADLASAFPFVSPERVENWRGRLSVLGDAPRRALDTLDRLGGHLIAPESVTGLSDLGDRAPIVLWARGDLSALDNNTHLGQTGARAATGYGEHVAIEFATDLARRGVTLHTGASYGIDGVTMQAAIAAGGSTVTWLASGLDRPYPAGHGDLIHRAAATPGSVVVTEVAPGVTPTRWRFLARGRCIASATRASLIVEASWRSGALNVAREALMLGRGIGAVSGPITSPSSAGCHRLIREHGATLVTSAEEAFELIS